MGSSSSKVTYIGHLEGTSYHQTGKSWKKYYEETIDLRKEDSYKDVDCPCTYKFHSLISDNFPNPVGAHVYRIDKHGYITFGIVLTCNECNKRSNQFIETCQIVTMINCPTLKCVPFNIILRELTDYTFDDNKLEFNSKNNKDEKIEYKIKNKSGNYINFIVNLEILSNFFNLDNTIIVYKFEDKKRVKSPLPKLPGTTDDTNKEITHTEEKIEYKLKIDESYEKFKVFNEDSVFTVTKVLPFKPKEGSELGKYLSNKLYRYWCTMMTYYCKNKKERRNRKCHCGNKFSNSSSGNWLIFAKNDNGECFVGVVPFCETCIAKKPTDLYPKGKSFYAVSIINFYTLTSALDFPNITKIIYEKNKTNFHEDKQNTLFDNPDSNSFPAIIRFIHGMHKIRKEVHENCDAKEKEFVPQVVKVVFP